jgi:cell wall-associated NlpC family hydrolase
MDSATKIVDHGHDHLKTGDLILCDNTGHGVLGWFGWIIKYFTYSDYSHVGIVLKDPAFAKVPLKGLYIWESILDDASLDIEDDKKKRGVQIVPLEEFIRTYTGKLYTRSVRCGSMVGTDSYSHIFSESALKEIHDATYDKPYDVNPIDWIGCARNKDLSPQKTGRFWCSAFVGYVYTKLGLMEPNTDWSNLTPSYFSTENRQLSLLKGATFEGQMALT